MSKQLELIRQIKSEMFLLSHEKMKEIKEIIFHDENDDNIVFVLVQNRYGEICDMPVKRIIWDEKTENINVELFDNDWGIINIYDILDCSLVWLFDTIIDY